MNRLIFLLSFFILASCAKKVMPVLDSHFNRHLKTKLTNLSACLKVSKETIYSLDYSCLDSINETKFKRISDSLYSESLVPYGYNEVRKYLFVTDLESTLSTNHKISTKDIRLYFGKETTSGYTIHQDSLLFYYFDNPAKDCLSTKSMVNKYGSCALLTFRFSLKDSLMSVVSDEIKYK